MHNRPLQPLSSLLLWRELAREGAAVWLSLFALGLGLGVLVSSAGLPWWLAPLLSASVYAGSVEFLLVGMLASQAPLSAIALTTLLVNSRHLFYGLAFPLHRVEGWGKLYSIYSLTDEAFALIAGRQTQLPTSRHILGTQLALQLSWVGGSIAGALLGSSVLNEIAGLDFILTALFIVLALEAWRQRADRITALLALLSGGVAAWWQPETMLLTALTAFCLLAGLRHAWQRQHSSHQPERADDTR